MRSKRSCAVGAGMTHHCTLMMLDKTLAMRDRLRNAISPGKKRSLPNPEFHLEKIELSDVDDLTPASRRELEVEQR